MKENAVIIFILLQMCAGDNDQQINYMPPKVITFPEIYLRS